VRRHLFEETAAARLSAGAELVLARAAARDARQAVEQALLQEVLGAYLAVEARRAHERNLEALDRVRDATPDPEQRRAVERQILRERKSLLQRDIALLSLDPEIRRDLDALYQQATDVAEAWAANLPQAGTPAPPSPRIRAQRLTEEAARRRGGLWFLPFVANPTLTAGLDYDIADGSLGWSVGVQLSVPVLDRGERRVSAGQRRRAAELESIRLREMERSHKTAVETAWRRLAILEIDAELAALDIEDAEAKAVTERRLFEGGFATEEAAVLAEVEAAVATLQYRQVLDEVLLEKLDILFQFFDEEIDE
jgi:outer membrane protein TolC